MFRGRCEHRALFAVAPTSAWPCLLEVYHSLLPPALTGAAPARPHRRAAIRDTHPRTEVAKSCNHTAFTHQRLPFPSAHTLPCEFVRSFRDAADGHLGAARFCSSRFPRESGVGRNPGWGRAANGDETVTRSLVQLLGWDGLTLTSSQRATHTHVIGQTGTGKSRTLESWVMQDIVAGQGLAVIDPHGDLYQNLVLRISGPLPRYPQLADRVILINPNDPVWTVGFNPLEPVRGIPLERLAWFLTDVIIKNLEDGELCRAAHVAAHHL